MSHPKAADGRRYEHATLASFAEALRLERDHNQALVDQRNLLAEQLLAATREISAGRAEVARLERVVHQLLASRHAAAGGRRSWVGRLFSRKGA